jgi:RNA polymerase sigma-70 factor (ECF subfamily)
MNALALPVRQPPSYGPAAFLERFRMGTPPWPTLSFHDRADATGAAETDHPDATGAFLGLHEGEGSAGRLFPGDPLAGLVRDTLEEYPHATAAFGRLVHATWDAAFQVCQAILLNAHDAEECTQETFLRAHRHLAGYRGESPFAGWLRRIARNAALSRLAARRRERDIRDKVAADPVLLRAWRPKFGRAEGSLSGDVLKALGSLGPDDRMVVVLHDLAGVPHAEIADELGLSAGAVRMRLSRARRRLRSRLERVMAEERP